MKEAVFTAASVGLAAMLAVPMPTHSQRRLKVLADTPLRPALIEIGEAFRLGSGQQVDFVFDSSPVILKKLADGEAADVLIVQPDHVADLIKAGKVVPGEHPVIGRVGLGLAARADALPQSVATVEALREVLLKADTLLFNTVVSGDQFAAVLEKLNLAEAVKAKVVRLPAGPGIYERVMRGQGNDIAVGVIPLIKETRGVRLIGSLPVELQTYQVYAAALMTAAASGYVAEMFVTFLTNPAAKTLFSANGVE
ncbi:MAG: substrate-binding domain-containing protein [Tepidisphaeraceae bacterium]